MNERIREIVLRFFEGTITAEEECELYGFLNGNPQGLAQMREWESCWKRDHVPPADVLDSLDSLRRKIRRRRPLRRLWLRISAAAAVLALVSTLVLHLLPAERPEQLFTVEAPQGTHSRISLPDGTQVWLIYDSRLYYPESFDGNLRSVRLEGEALFNVVRDASKPFRVRTSLMEVEVLGTVFDLKCYEHLDYAELVLVSGSVKATCAGQLPVTLCPDERLVAYRNSKKIDYQAVDANNYNKWMFETQKLDEMRLDAVFVNLEHRYNVEFDIADDVGLEARLTLSLRSEPLEEILDAIALVVPIRYESSGGTIFITRR